MNQFSVWKCRDGTRMLVVRDRPYFDRIWGFWKPLKTLP